MVICPNCGNENNDNASFCGSCGSPALPVANNPGSSPDIGQVYGQGNPQGQAYEQTYQQQNQPGQSPGQASQYGYGQTAPSQYGYAPVAQPYPSTYGQVPVAAAKDKTVAILLAALLGFFFLSGFWTWLYTYERDKSKFWIGLGVVWGGFIGGWILGVLTLGILLFVPILALFAGLGISIWAVVDAASRPDSFYRMYPHG